jgi:TonB family protein
MKKVSESDFDFKTESNVSKETVVDTDDHIYDLPDKLAKFAAGDSLGYVYFETRVALLLKKYKKRGTVFISFVIEKDSTASNVKVLKGLTEIYDAEAVNMISKAKWSPAQVNHKVVRSKLVYPVQFTEHMIK